MKSDFLSAARNYPYKAKFMQLVYDTPIEVAIGAVALGGLFGGCSYVLSDGSANMVPTAFSEIGAIKREAARENRPVPPLTRHYAKTSDVVMKVEEARNLSEKENGSHRAFAQELEAQMDPALKVHHLISEYAKEIPNDANAAVEALPKLTTAMGTLPPVISAFSNTWSRYSSDNTHQDCKPVERCSGSGKDRSCSTSIECTTVCDSTDYTYNYHREEGLKAARLLGEFVTRLPDMKTDERLQLAKETGADNEYAIESSMKELFKGKIITPQEALKFANIWATGSNFTAEMPVIEQNHAELKRLSPVWASTARTAKDEHHRSLICHLEIVPDNVKLSDKLEETAQTVLTSSHKIIDGIQFAGANVPKLSAKIDRYIGVVLDGKKGDAGDLRSDIMDLTHQIYEKNYEKGLNIDPFNVSPILLWTLFGLAAGAGAGAGVNHMINKRRRRQPMFG
jgi:hypothetical protein